MRKILRHVIIMLSLSSFVLVGSARPSLVHEHSGAVDSNSVAKKIDERRVQRSFFSSFRSFFPFRANDNINNEKLLSSVKVFPNPVADQINLSFRLSKQSTVSIKVMDALGNEVMTLLNQYLEAGNQSHTFETSNKLTNGFYFIRMSAGTETVVKRISVL